MEIEGQQVRKGGGFVPYHVPRVPGHYSFSGQARKGGFLKREKLQWYAGFQDNENYILFTVDGKHAIVREVQDGKSHEVSRVPFSDDLDKWVQVDMAVKSASIDVRVRAPDSEWVDLGPVSAPGRDLTQDKVGLYVPGGDEIAVANFRFSAR
jgi:hypothetical protein